MLIEKEDLVKPFSLWMNKKTKNNYVVEAVHPDYTNAREGQFVVLYYQATNVKIRGVREISEFLEKFEELKDYQRLAVI